MVVSQSFEFPEVRLNVAFEMGEFYDMAILHYCCYKQSKIHILKHPFSSPGNYLQEVF